MGLREGVSIWRDLLTESAYCANRCKDATANDEFELWSDLADLYLQLANEYATYVECKR